MSAPMGTLPWTRGAVTHWASTHALADHWDFTQRMKHLVFQLSADERLAEMDARHRAEAARLRSEYRLPTPRPRRTVTITITADASGVARATRLLGKPTTLTPKES